MQFFYIDYYNGHKKERNIGFLRIEDDGISVGLRGVPMQCGKECSVYAINELEEKYLLGNISIKNGYGMEKLKWTSIVSFKDCARIEIPLYGTRFGQCIIRDKRTINNDKDVQSAEINDIISLDNNKETDLVVEKIVEHKWTQLMNTYQQVHIYPEAQTILIKPRDIIILTKEYHSLATNSFLLHSYYNYRQLLLFRYPFGTENLENKAIDLKAAQIRDTADVEYYLGVAGIYRERDRRLAELFGFEGFECGESRMNEESKRQIYSGCFGYYMKKVEI